MADQTMVALHFKRQSLGWQERCQSRELHSDPLAPTAPPKELIQNDQPLPPSFPMLAAQKTA